MLIDMFTDETHWGCRKDEELVEKTLGGTMNFPEIFEITQIFLEYSIQFKCI